jgi:hypothetical protein
VTTIYLAIEPGARNLRVFDGIADADMPSVLVSFPYAGPFLRERERYRVRSWVMDSGAYTAWQTGRTVDLSAYIDCCQRVASDPVLDFVVALDVIGSWRDGLRNVERMWQAGVPAVPTYHIGEPEDLLIGLARDYPRVCVGGVALLHGPARRRFAEQVFARVWPKRIHGLAIGNEADVMAAPWSSVDASSWSAGPRRFGKWRAFGDRHLAIRTAHDLRAEVRWYLGLEQRARWRWRREMSALAATKGAHSGTDHGSVIPAPLVSEGG